MKNFAPVERDIVELRRDLHLHPELSGCEARTGGIVAAELERLGIRVLRAPEPGRSLAGVMECGRPGKTLALRADMDALPMKENPCNLKGAKSFVSLNDGAAHMCGHDFHTAGLLSVARRLAEVKDGLAGRVVFCFESGEEMGMGDDARGLLKSLAPVDAVYGVHIKADYPVGTAAVIDGACTAGCEIFRLTVTGRSVHGATPHLGADPVNCAAQIVCASNSIVARRINSRDAAVLSVCSIHGGSTWNRIPDDCRIEGGLRFFSAEVEEQLRVMLEQTASGVAAACGCSVSSWWSNRTMPVINDPSLVRAARAAAEAVGVELIAGEPWMASETFARFGEICPVVLAFVGCANPEKGCGAPHHNDKFDADEDCLAVSSAMTVRFARDFLR